MPLREFCTGDQVKKAMKYSQWEYAKLTKVWEAEGIATKAGSAKWRLDVEKFNAWLDAQFTKRTEAI